MDLYRQFNTSTVLDPKFDSLFRSFTDHSITSIELLSLTVVEISKKTGRPISEINSFLEILFKEIDDSIAIKQYNNEINNDLVTTGDSDIDRLIGGGIPKECITEVFGQSSSGKSHFLMQLAICAQLPIRVGGTGKQVVYISTERYLHTGRLENIASYINLKYGLTNEEMVGIDKILQVTCGDLDLQNHTIEIQLPILLEQNDVGLVIIDSISHHIRVEMVGSGFSSMKKRKFYLKNLGVHLHNLATKHKLAVLLSNQVSDKPLLKSTSSDPLSLDNQMGWFSGWDDKVIKYRQINTEESHMNSSNDKSYSVTVPTLSLDWTNYIDVRILLQKKYQPIDDNGVFEKWRATRTIKLVYSPFVDTIDGDQSMEFEIFQGGIRGVL